MKDTDVVVATLSKGKTLLFVGLVVLFGIVVTLVLLWHPTGETFESYHRSRGLFGLEKALLGLLCISLLLWQQVRLVLFLVTDSPGVWLSDGQIRYVNNFSVILVRKIPRDGIRSLSVKDDGMFNRRGILVTANGSETIVPTWLFAEGPETILANLRAQLFAH